MLLQSWSHVYHIIFRYLVINTKYILHVGAVICSQPTKTKLLKTFPKYDRALLLRKAFSNSGSASENHLHLKTIKLLDKESCYLNLIISLL